MARKIEDRAYELVMAVWKDDRLAFERNGGNEKLWNSLTSDAVRWRAAKARGVV
jgi:hypothetical protein